MHCKFCGFDLKKVDSWPHLCKNCKNTIYKNPIPVIICLLEGIDIAHILLRRPKNQIGIVLIRRSSGRMAGSWALPGGFMDFNDESWQHSASREVAEETGLIVPHFFWKPFDVATSRDKQLLVFVKSSGTPMKVNTDNPYHNNETDAIRIAYSGEELAFPTHTEALKKYFAQSQRFA